MNGHLLVLSRNQALVDELERKLQGEHRVVGCDSLDVLRQRIAASEPEAVLVHLGADTLNGYSAGRFLAELREVKHGAALYGLLDATCPPRLQDLASRTVDECLNLPLDYTQLTKVLAHPADLERELEGFWRGMPHKELHGRTRSLVTFTPDMFEMMDEIKVAARHNVTALLIGETGCGKTFLARLIHELSDRCDERFCTVACGALPPELIESELFGSVKGAFTGADADRDGKFAAAGKGTLLLDEIDVLPPDQQAKLLRVIETGEYEQVGSNDTQFSQARLVVASNYDLEDLVRGGTFRTDLYYRLNILNFHVPPLRARPWDIEYLARKFALEHSRTHGIRLRAIEPDFLEALRKYQWPGNIREMENVIRRAVLYCQRGVLAATDLPSSIRAATQGRPLRTTPSMGAFMNHGAPHGYPTRPPGNVPISRATTLAPSLKHQGESTYNGDSQANGQPASLEVRVDMLERRIIEDALQRNNHRRKQTAAELGISRVTLYNKMKKHGLL